MGLEKTIEYDKIEIIGKHKEVHCRKAIIVKEDGVELSRTFDRYTLNPSSCLKNEDGSYTHTDTDISGEPEEIQAICKTVWTDDVKSAWQSYEESYTNVVG